MVEKATQAEWADDPGTALFMTELTVPSARWEPLIAWYEQNLGLRTVLRDDLGGFALLAAGSGRLAFKRGDETCAGPTGMRLVFLVGDLDAEHTRLQSAGVPVTPPEDHPREPYRFVRLADPTGTPITLFAWRS